MIRYLLTDTKQDWHWPSFSSPIHILEWHHFCLSYSTTERRIRLLHNNDLEVDYVRPPLGDMEDFIPSGWFGPHKENKEESVRRFCPDILI